MTALYTALAKLARLVKLAVVFVGTCALGWWFAHDAARSLGRYALVTLPGTFMHELAHYCAALVSDGHPSGFSIIPTGDT